jgi:hypothetical protein
MRQRWSSTTFSSDLACWCEDQILYTQYTVEEGNFEHLFNFEAHLKIWQIFFQHFLV